ncbi:MAG: hypothetical protein RMJ03_06040 [Nitrososphaerota archaeon]|nr:hypothetical protein [Nitrososphaerota archaeon]
MMFLLVDMFLWYYLTLNTIAVIAEELGVEHMGLLFAQHVGVLVGGFLGIAFLKDGLRGLLLWTFLGTSVSFLPLLTPDIVYLRFQEYFFVLGLSLGLGMPLCLGFFAKRTATENRGYIGGIVLAVSIFCATPMVSLVRLYGSQTLLLFLGVWRALGFVPLLIWSKVPWEKPTVENTEEPTLLSRKLYLYWVPWAIFNIIDGLEWLLLRNFVRAMFSAYLTSLQWVGFLFLGTFAFLGGYLSDLVGRKPVIILGFSMIGVAYAVISMVPNSLAAWFLFYICSGVSWGLFTTIFIVVIWGDLASTSAKEKYYLVGITPFFMAAVIQKFFAAHLMFLSETSAFSLAAVFLFVAVLPILFAPETLPEKVLKERELRNYIERAKRVKEKFTRG